MYGHCRAVACNGSTDVRDFLHCDFLALGRGAVVCNGSTDARDFLALRFFWRWGGEPLYAMA